MVDSKNYLQAKIKNIKDEIAENQIIYNKAKSGEGQQIMVVLGFIGLLFFIIPGLICFVIAAIQYNNNKNIMLQTSAKINELKRQLLDLEFQLDKKDD